MSYQLAFWAYGDGRRSNRVADRRTYLKLIKGRKVKDVAPLDTARVLDELAIYYGTWRRTDSYHFSHPTHGSFDVWIAGGTFVSAEPSGTVLMKLNLGAHVGPRTHPWGPN